MEQFEGLDRMNMYADIIGCLAADLSDTGPSHHAWGRSGEEEYAHLKSQIVTSSWGGMRRAYPYAFTEQGVAMLSSVLRSRQAIEANVSIMRVFVKVREIGAQNREILQKLDALERRINRNEADIGAIIDSIREDVQPPDTHRRRIGFSK